MKVKLYNFKFVGGVGSGSTVAVHTGSLVENGNWHPCKHLFYYSAVCFAIQFSENDEDGSKY